MYGNEPLDTIKWGEFLVLPSDYKFYKNNPSPRNYLADKFMTLRSNKQAVLYTWTSALVICNSANPLGPTEDYLLLCHSKREGRIQRSVAPPDFLKPCKLPRISLYVCTALDHGLSESYCPSTDTPGLTRFMGGITLARRFSGFQTKISHV